MSVRKRKWKTQKGEQREAWVVDYTDQQGERILKTFTKKRDADQFAATATVEVREGVHVADSASITVKEAGAAWIKVCELGDDERLPLERATLDQYRQHLRLHIDPFLGNKKLSQITTPEVQRFASTLRANGRSPTMVKYVIRSLGAILSEAQGNGAVVRNAVSERRRTRLKRGGNDRRGSKLKIGVDIPEAAEIKSLVAALYGSKWRPLLVTAIFTGLRASELRGLRWPDVDLKGSKLHVRQRADRYRTIGKPKTEASERTIPLFPIVANTLREWKLRCPKSADELVFPNGDGNVEFHVNIIERGLKPAMIAAGVTVPVLDDEGKPLRDDSRKPVVAAKYTGMHTLRHWYASWLINKKPDGLELPPKVIQYRMGHSSINVTFDTYGHLFPQSDDGAELAEAQRALLG
jgi:integrase